MGRKKLKSTTSVTTLLLSVVVILLFAVNSLKGETDSTKSTDAKQEKVFTADSTTAYELPATNNKVSEQILKRKAYTASYNADLLIPNWVAWQLTADHVDGTVERPGNAFHEDEDVASPRATLQDYRRSGWDRGHMCPAGDCKWDETAMYESFLFTNMCPQHPRLNSGDWNEIESTCRQWAKKYGTLYIACGPVLYDGEHKKIGENGVVVPEAFFKVVIRLGDNPAGIGFVCKNTSGNKTPAQYVNTIDDIERITGYDFFPNVPDDIENAIEAHADIEEW